LGTASANIASHIETALIESEKILEGEFQAQATEDSIFISVSDNLKEGLKIEAER
jgi:hypothetical protein